MRTTVRLIALLLLVALRPALAADGDDAAQWRRVRLEELARGAADALSGIRDYTCQLSTQERIGGELEPASGIFMKHRREPGCVYMRWTDGPSTGREAIHCEGANDGALLVREGSGLGRLLGTLSLDPKGSVAMRGNRHPITRAGIFYPVHRLQEDLDRARRHADHEVFVEDVSDEVVEGQPSVCGEVRWPSIESYGYYVPRSEICFHRELRVPTRVESYDASGARLETYVFYDFALNVGLTDGDFDVANPAYGF